MSNVLPECMRCDYFEPQDDLVGECRRLAPRPVAASGLDYDDPDAMMALWPVVSQDDWCGAFVEASRNRSVRNQSLMKNSLAEAQARLARRPAVAEDDTDAEAGSADAGDNAGDDA